MALPKAEEVTNIAQLGFGIMGHTWSTTLLMAGLEVHVYEPDRDTRHRNGVKVQGHIARGVAKGKLDGEVDDFMSRLHIYTTQEELVAAINEFSIPVLLEVVFEDLALKCGIFEELCPQLPDDVVIWSNTSCLSVETMAVASGRPGLFVGTHGMNPVHLMLVVEVVRHAQVSEEALQFTCDLLTRIGKQPGVTADVPGFVVNKLGMPFWLEAIRLLERGQATVADTDLLLKGSLGHPQGAFLLLDWIGMRTMVLVAEALYEQTQDPRYLTPPLLLQMIEAGNNGRDTGQGFYDYSDPRNPRALSLEELTTPKD